MHCHACSPKGLWGRLSPEYYGKSTFNKAIAVLIKICSAFTVFLIYCIYSAISRAIFTQIKTLPLISLKSEIWAQEGSRLIANSFKKYISMVISFVFTSSILALSQKQFTKVIVKLKTLNAWLFLSFELNFLDMKNSWVSGNQI